MKELLKKLEDVIQESGYQCIRIKDYYDFAQKLNCMGGYYKGFVMTEEPEDKFCMLYIDTVEMGKEAEKRSFDFSRHMMTISPENRIYLSNMPEEYIRKYTDYTTLGFYLRATKEYNKFYYEKKEKDNESILKRLKKMFTPKR